MMEASQHHPQDELLRWERLPHIWCPGCGLGAALQAFVRALRRSEVPLEQQVVVSGIGCTGRSAGYLGVDSYHTTHGRAIPFATGLKIAKPELSVTVFSGDGDLFNIGGNHFIHAARRNLNLNVFCVNNFVYGMTGGQFGATTPIGALTATSPYGNFEPTFNLPHLAAAVGASFVARWTTLHVHQLARSMEMAMAVDGFAFIEILSPCPPGFGRHNRLREGLDQMRYFREKAVIHNDARLEEIAIDVAAGSPVVLGNFLHRRRRSYLSVKREMLARFQAAPVPAPTPRRQEEAGG